MTKTKSQQPGSKPTRQPRKSDVAGEEDDDVCELVLAELRARRVRLRKLLHLLQVEAERMAAAKTRARSRAKCGS